jgi:hypothetical protein
MGDKSAAQRIGGNVGGDGYHRRGPDESRNVCFATRQALMRPVDIGWVRLLWAAESCPNSKRHPPKAKVTRSNRVGCAKDIKQSMIGTPPEHLAWLKQRLIDLSASRLSCILNNILLCLGVDRTEVDVFIPTTGNELPA